MRRSLSRASCALVFACILIHPPAALAVWNPAGELVPTPELHAQPTGCPDGTGGAFSFWSEYAVDGLPPTTVTLWGHRRSADGSDSPGWPSSGRVIARFSVDHFTTFAYTSSIADGNGGAFVLATDPSVAGPNRLRRLFHVLANGELAPGWPDAGVAMGDSTKASVSQLIADGVGGAFVGWTDFVRIDLRIVPTFFGIYESRATRVGPNGTFAPGWSASGRVLEGVASDSLEAFYSPSLRLAADPVGGLFAANADSSDGDPSYHVWHYAPGGGLAPGWPAAGVALHPWPGTALTAFASDGVGGIYAAWSDSLTYPDGGAPRLVRLDGSGAVHAGWPAGGIVPFASSQPHRALGAAVADGQGGLYLLGSSFDLSAHSQLHIVRRDGTGALHPGWSPQGVTVQESLWVVIDHPPVPDGLGGIYAVWMASRDAGASAFDLRSLRLRADGSAATGWSLGAPRRVSMPPQAFLRAAAGDGHGSCYALSRLSDGLSNATWLHQIAPDDANTLATPAPLAGASGLALAANPNPARGSTELSFVLPRDSRASIAIHDANGRRVWHRGAAMRAGSHRVTWDGRTDTGAPAAAGVYFAVVRAGSLGATRRIAVVR